MRWTVIAGQAGQRVFYGGFHFSSVEACKLRLHVLRGIGDSVQNSILSIKQSRKLFIVTGRNLMKERLNMVAFCGRRSFREKWNTNGKCVPLLQKQSTWCLRLHPSYTDSMNQPWALCSITLLIEDDLEVPRVPKFRSAKVYSLHQHDMIRVNCNISWHKADNSKIKKGTLLLLSSARWRSWNE